MIVGCALAVAAQAQTPLVDLKTTEFTGAERTAAGVKCALKLPAKRSNWTSADWKIAKLPAPIKLDGDAIRITVKTDKPRGDVGVYIALGEADGSWYCHPWAANLTQVDNTGVAQLKDFSPCEWTSPSGGKFNDENGQLDADQIAFVAIGSINPLGVGTVEFIVTELSVVQTDVKPTAPVNVEVTGQLLDVNGTQFIPAGVFGSFNLQSATLDGQNVRRAEYYRLASDRSIHGAAFPTPTTHMIIQVIGGDRGSASPRLTNPNWEQSATEQGTKLGAAAKAAGRPVYVEYYNEPYLNWANKNRRSFRPLLFDESKATEGGPVHIKTDGKVAPFLKWTQNYDAPAWSWCSRRDWRRGKDADGKVYSDFAEPTPWGRKGSSWAPETHPPDSVKDGETYKVMVGKKGQEKEVTLTAFTPWQVYDETQFTYWSSKGLAMFYNDPAVAFGKAFKAAGGDKAVYIVGWGNRPSEDHWAGFHNLYKDTIDHTVAFIDGVNDHDYGGDPTKMSANYEVICAYGVTAHNKWLHGYNTECSGAYDPEAIASAAGQGSPELAGARWVAAKILHALDYVPDKARNFAHFGGGNFFRDEGEGVALKALMNLRGRLLQVKHDDPEVYIAAAVDGTDPLNPRPASLPAGKELVVAAYNAALIPREVNLQVAAPKGTTLGAPVVRVLKSDAGKPALIEAKTSTVTLGSRELLVATYPLTGDVADTKPVTREQTFAKVVLQEVTPAAPVKTQLAAKLPATRAWIQFVAERLGEGEAKLTLNGTVIALPSCVTPENSPWLRRLAIDPKLLKVTNDVTVEIADKSQAGFLLGSLSLVVEQE
jgi:hypothetical protein